LFVLFRLSLSCSAKKIYNDQSNDLKAKFDKDLKKWEATSGGAVRRAQAWTQLASATNQ
jgi:hypothetical protein